LQEGVEESKKPLKKVTKLSKQDMFLRLNKGKADMS